MSKDNSRKNNSEHLDTWAINHDNGEKVLMQGNSARVFVDKNVSEAAAVNIDVDDRLRAGNALQKAKEKSEKNERIKSDLLLKLHETQKSAKIGNWEWDVVQDTVMWSDEVYNIFELDPSRYNPDSIINTRHIHPKDYIIYHEEIRKVIESGNVLNFDLRIITPAGKIKHCNLKGNIERDQDSSPIRIIGTFMDITDRKEAELSCAAEKEHLAVTLKSIADGVIITDNEGNILMLNKAAEELTGWSSSEAVGKSLAFVFNIINGLTKQPCENPVEKVLKSGRLIELASDTLLISKDGRSILIANSCSPIRNNEGRIISVILVFRDITEKHKLSESMQRVQKLESIGVLAGGIAHDFNNLLSGIFGYLEIANENISLGKIEDATQYITKAISVFDRAQALTHQLLNFSKSGSPIRRTMQLAPLIKKTVQFALCGSNIACEFDIVNDIWLCDCDENQISQVIDNIVINAKQAMPMGGKIIITGQNSAIRHDHGSTYLHSGNFVKFSIKDHGIGMPKEILSQIFDPFFSTKETGHGLGLATAFSIIQCHGGWIDVESESGIGSTFHIFIPASQKQAAIRVIDKEVKYHCNGETILIMDDEKFMLDIIDSMLQRMGHKVILAKSGDEAIHNCIEAQKSGNPVTACILDLTIPGCKGGKEAAVHLRKISSNIILIASSGYSDDPVMTNPAGHGFTDSIVKPFRKAELTALLTRTLANRNK